jgi:F-type H+-transporting ATPase subunit delta
MRSHRAASRYAKSLIELAKEQNTIDEVYADMQLFTAVVQENRVFAVMLKNPIINHEKKRNVLHALFDKRMNKLSILAFDLITKKNRESILEQIAAEFQIQYNNLKGLQVADVTTTISLDEDLKTKFRDLVREISGKTAQLSELVNEDIVGGFILNVGDRRLDQSIKSKLNNIKRVLTN